MHKKLKVAVNGAILLCLALIVAPEGAPEWTQDREELWNRIERAEVAKNAQLAMDWIIAIPREIPEEQREQLARDLVAPFVEAGAVADIAYHRPRASDKGEHPHFHIMLSLRKLDDTTKTGFAKTKNKAIEAMHTSGGRYGGKRAEALIAQRKRISEVMNIHLERAGSPLRTSHESYAARGIDRDPEPKMGEQRKRAVTKRGKHDSVTSLVARMRAANALENELARTEEEIMALNPKFQTPNAPGGLRRKHQQDFKARLLTRRFPDAAMAIDAQQLYMIDKSRETVTRIQTRDGGWLEVDQAGRTIRTWGQRGYADQVAKAISTGGYADHIERLEEMQAVGRKGGITPRRKGEPVPEQDFAKVESLADRWRSRGFTNVTEAVDGCWVHVGSCKIQDLGNQVRIHGKVNDDAVRAMLLKAADEWGAETEVYGSKEFKDAVWIEAQRMGVTVYDKDTGELYEPSPEIRKAFEADRAKVAEASKDLETAKDQKELAELVKTAATGDMKAIAELENSGEASLAHFVVFHLDKKQREGFAGLSAAEVAEGLPEYRKAGTAAREKFEAEGVSEAKAGINLKTVALDDDDENDPVPVHERGRWDDPDEPREAYDPDYAGWLEEQKAEEDRRYEP